MSKPRKTSVKKAFDSLESNINEFCDYLKETNVDAKIKKIKSSK